MSTGDFSPEWIILEANMREFAHNISIICALESGGKITAEEAYVRIKDNWKRLKSSHKTLLSENPPPAK